MARTLLFVACALVVGTALAADTAPNTEENPTYYLEDQCTNLGEVRVNTVNTIRLKGNQDPLLSRSCKLYVVFKASDPSYYLQATIRKFHLSDRSPQGPCLSHFLQMSDGSNNGTYKMCQKRESLKGRNVIQSHDSSFDFYYFRNAELLPEHDIDITVATVFKADFFKGCPNQTFECPESGLCLPHALKCDGSPNCNDQSDEQDCPGTDSIVSTTPYNTDRKNPEKVEPDGSNQSSSKDTHAIIIGVGGGIIVIALVAIIALVIIKRIRGQKGDFSAVSTTEIPAPQQSAQSEDNVEERNVDASTSFTPPRSEVV